MTWTIIGEGLNAFFQRSARAMGVLRDMKTIDDSLELYEENPGNTIILMHTAGVTAIAPIISKVKGVICTKGGVSSHLAILSREFRIPCIMAANLHHDGGFLNGREVMILLNDRKGFVYLKEGESH